MNLVKLDRFRWIIPKTGGMRVEGMVYASERLLKKMEEDKALLQVANVAHLPGIVGRSIGMPDLHWGYGFPIGGVAATSADDGVISPGGVGYDINCGVRVLTSRIPYEELKDHMEGLIARLFKDIPTGVGSEGNIRLSKKELESVAKDGVKWAIKKGYMDHAEADHIEEGGHLEGADPKTISDRAYERGKSQLGTLGSGNHFLEVGVVEEVFDAALAEAFGITQGTVAFTIHSGSRGFGHQVCDDYIKEMVRAFPDLLKRLPDRQLVCAPIRSDMGKKYISAMKGAANFAWVNRTIISHLLVRSVEKFLRVGPNEHGIRLLYDVCHNIAKFEEHKVGNGTEMLCVHRKGATRAFPKGDRRIPEIFRNTGHPVLIPGSMGEGTYILVGLEKTMEEAFGSCCHGAGRMQSRHKAIKSHRGMDMKSHMEKMGVIVMAKGKKTLLEEAPDAYKDLEEVVNVVVKAGLAKKVAKIRPVGCIKG